MEVPIELSNNYCCNLSLSIPNEQTLDRLKFSQEVPLAKEERHCYLKKRMPEFQLNCIDAQDDCLICLTETMGLSVHLTSHEQFSPN